MMLRVGSVRDDRNTMTSGKDLVQMCDVGGSGALLNMVRSPSRSLMHGIACRKDSILPGTMNLQVGDSFCFP